MCLATIGVARSVRRRLARSDRSLLTDAKSQRGIAALEFAMVLPAALLLVLGVLQFAQMFLVYRDLLAAASSAARTGTIQNSTVAEVNSALAVSLSGTAVGTNYDAQITGVGPTANGDTLVTVQVTHDFPLFFSIPGIAEENGTVPLTSSVTMRHE